MNKFKIISGFVENESGYSPTIKIKSEYSPGIFTFDKVTKNIEYGARSFAMEVIGKFESYRRDKLEGKAEWILVGEAMQFFKGYNKLPIIET